MKKGNKINTVGKTLAWIGAVTLAWLHGPLLGVAALVGAAIMGSEVCLHDEHE